MQDDGSKLADALALDQFDGELVLDERPVAVVVAAADVGGRHWEKDQWLHSWAHDALKARL